LANPALAEQPDEADPGRKLFEQHGCTNCHGADGIHPTSKYAPVLRGKSADYLYEHATAIFGGTHQSSKTRFMHEQFCVGQAQEEGCYQPPDAAALRSIANWLSGDTTIPDSKKSSQGLNVTAVEAYKRLSEAGDKALLIDVRTRAEVAFLGMPSIAAANIPYMSVGGFDGWDEKKQTFKLVPKSEFTMRVEDLLEKKGLSKDSPIYLSLSNQPGRAGGTPCFVRRR
jgi:cytochrome c553/rhodanese-related sulfurtransferase